jgi:hypothetical protein
MLFEALDASFIVVESYSLVRSMNLLKDGLPFRAGGQEVNWRWLAKGEGWRWLTENPDWDWFRNEGHWDHINAEDNHFLEAYGFKELFDTFDVAYINVTEEVWNGRVADPIVIQQAVESRFKPVQEAKLYHSVPQKLYDLRGSTFVSLARLKMYASFTFKNMFGLIPDPLRPWWHGRENQKINQSILDINKVYHALFNVYGICEEINTAANLDPNGEYKGVYTGRYSLSEGTGTVFLGRDLVQLDALLLSLSDPTQKRIADFNRTSIQDAQGDFGEIDQSVIQKAREVIGNYL